MAAFIPARFASGSDFQELPWQQTITGLQTKTRCITRYNYCYITEGKMGIEEIRFHFCRHLTGLLLINVHQ
jgi:hypothetical protein